MSGCHAVFLLICPSLRLCLRDEHEIECLHVAAGVWTAERDSLAGWNEMEMKWIFKINVMSKLPAGFFSSTAALTVCCMLFIPTTSAGELCNLYVTQPHLLKPEARLYRVLFPAVKLLCMN